MIKDAINSFRLTLDDRVGNPFVSAFLLSSVFVNWKLTLLLTSGLGYEEKLEKVDVLYQGYGSGLTGFVIVPFFFACFWTFIWPQINLRISSYWYGVKASTSNARISAERKRNLSVNEAAELYYKIDEQEGKYLELIKDRKEKIDDLTQKIEDEFEHLSQLQEEVVEKNSMISDLKRRVSSLEVQLEKSESNVAKSESDKALVRQDFEEAVKSAHVVANYFPGILRITELVESANNYHAGEDWLKTKLLEDKKRISEDGYRNMLNFFVAVKMFERKPNGTITFGERFLYEKGLILKMRDNVDQNART